MTKTKSMRQDEEHAKGLLARLLGFPESCFQPGDDPPDYVLTTPVGVKIGVEITTAEAVTENDGELLPRRQLDEPILRLVERLDIQYRDQMDQSDKLFLFLSSSAKSYNEIPKLTEEAVKKFVVNPELIEAVISSKDGEEIGETWRDKRKVGSSRAIGGAVMNMNTPSLVAFQTEAMVATVLSTKERKLKRWESDKWLLFYSHYPLSEPEEYARAATKFALSHSFSKVFLMICPPSLLHSQS